MTSATQLRPRRAFRASPLLASVVLYPALALICAYLVLASLHPQLGLPSGAPQAGSLQGAERVFGPTELAAAEAGPGFVHYVAHQNGAPSGLRVGVAPDIGPLNPADAGVRLPLDPAAFADLAGKPVRVRLRMASIDVANAQRLAVALETPLGREFVEQPLALGEATIVFDLPSPPTAPEAIVLRPISDRLDYTVGVEILVLAIGPRP